MVAELLAVPGPLSLDEIVPVMLVIVPVPVTSRSRVITQVPLATVGEVVWRGAVPDLRPGITGGGPGGPNVPPVRLREDDPDTAVNVPPQLLLRLLGVATTRPAGSESVKAMPVRVADGLGLEMVKLTLTVLFCATFAALNALAIVGGAVGITVKLAVLLLPE